MPFPEEVMIVKRFACPQCRRLLQTSVRRIRMACPVCGMRFTPSTYRLAVRKGMAIERIRLVTERSGN
jgi:hypothetical protein